MFGPGYYITAEIKARENVNPDTLTAALQELCADSLQEPGCTVFFFHQDSKNPSHFVLWERFDDEEAFKVHAQEPHTKKYASLGLSEMVKVIQSEKLPA